MQEKLIAQHRGRQSEAPFSSGRGGAGNISRSKSRSRSAVRDSSAHVEGKHHLFKHDGAGADHAHSHLAAGGRGGFGNMHETNVEKTSMEEEKEAANKRYEESVRNHHALEAAGHPMSTGRGGAGGVINHAPMVAGVDMSKLSLEEREAWAKVHAHDAEHGYTTGKG